MSEAIRDACHWEHVLGSRSLSLQPPPALTSLRTKEKRTCKKEKRTCKIVDVVCPFDTRVVEKEREKVDKYQELKYELKRIWNCSEVTVIPAVIGALGAISILGLIRSILTSTLEPYKRPVFLD